MRRRRSKGLKSACAAAAAIAVLGASCQMISAAACPLPQSTVDGIRALVAQYIEDDISPGLLLGIRCGDSYWIEAFGVSDISTGAPLEATHQFLIGSIAKQMVAAAVMRLVEDGRLSLESPISDYVQHLRDTWAGITVRQCLNHTSGTFSFAGLPVDTGSGALTAEAVIGFITSGRLSFPPGEDHLYSTVGYFILAYIVEQITGEPIDMYIERHFLEPLGMTETGFLKGRAPETLAGYHQHYWKGQAFYTEPPTTSWGLADGMYSTAADLFTWQVALASGEVVSESSWALMTQRTVTQSSDGIAATHDYGFGLEVHVGEDGEISEVGHWGNGGGHICFLAEYPTEDIALLALQNSNGRLAPLLEDIKAVLFNADSEG